MWHAYRIVYRLKSPLHSGWRKTGNLMQTRPFVPGRTWWGAATSHLTQWKRSCDYEAEGKFLKNNLVFGYFFLAEDPDVSLVPCWKEGCLCYGPLGADEFERCFISSRASTAIDYRHNTADEGQLHEVEFIVHRTGRGDVFLVGHLLAREGDRVTCNERDVIVDGLPLLNEVLSGLRIGGERRYGFGHLLLYEARRCKDIFGHRLAGRDDEWPIVELNQELPVPAHLKAADFKAAGQIEPLVGREWDLNRGPGRAHSEALICWMPGSRTRHADGRRAKIIEMGIWALRES